MIKFVNYDNCLINVSSSILKHFKIDVKHKTLKEVDEALLNKKKIILMLIDGMGINIINKHLDEDAYIRKNIKKNIFSCYPPTTASATTALLSCKMPIESGWLGWHLYLDDIHPSIILFRDEEYYNNKKQDYLDVSKIIGYESIIDKINNNGYKTFEIFPSFRPDGYESASDELDELERIIDNVEEDYFVYCYLDTPDDLLHENGVETKLVNQRMKYINERIEKIGEMIDKDSCLIIVADHGFTDCEPIDFSLFKDLNKMLTKKFSCEGRCAIFHVKEEEKKNFEYLFDYYFEDKFILLSKEDILKNYVFGIPDINGELKIHDSIKYSLGDYVAIATNKYFLSYDFNTSIKAHHAGATLNEVLIPLIIINK